MGSEAGDRTLRAEASFDEPPRPPQRSGTDPYANPTVLKAEASAEQNSEIRTGLGPIRCAPRQVLLPCGNS